MIKTRFAPSPTGELHIGGARTALFNYLFARHHSGKFLLRIEDTDKDRSNSIHTDDILDKLTWLGLHWDDSVIYQSQNIARHVEVAHQLLNSGYAYYDYVSKEELDNLRKSQELAKVPYKYDSKWRDNTSPLPIGVSPVIRLKMPKIGQTVINDEVQGLVTLENSQLDDMILLRADGTPTYMLSVVVDDYDMDITHIIRGDDHLNNAFRQIQICRAMGWKDPIYAHIPLIHAEDGKKLSKRNAAPGIGYFKDLGILPDALCNYLVKLGWGYYDEEIISLENMINWFNLPGIKRGPARLNFDKLYHLNSHYMKEMPVDKLIESIIPLIEHNINGSVSTTAADRITKGIDEAVKRSKTINELAKNLEFYVMLTGKRIVLDSDTVRTLIDIRTQFKTHRYDWTEQNISKSLKLVASDRNIPYGTMMMMLRWELTNTSTGYLNLSVAIEALGYDETMARIKMSANINY